MNLQRKTENTTYRERNVHTLGGKRGDLFMHKWASAAHDYRGEGYLEPERIPRTRLIMRERGGAF